MSEKCLYTSAELIQKLKDLDTKLDSGVTGSSLDTSQTKHDLKLSIRAARDQYQKYKSMFQSCYPSEYREYFGSSVIKFVGRK
ncbi:hypothetical protein KAR91_73630 [Candidatus Pacearchaeota archaeon]|nr:hypothetical protein [Candidatus Pacearchaeota archaeon]